MVKKLAARDVKPQILRLRMKESGTNTYTEGEVNTPNMTEAGYVMEILRIEFAHSTQPNKTTTGDEANWALSDSSKTVIPRLDQPGVLCRDGWGFDLMSSGAATSGGRGMYDFTDGAGNGLLYGKKTLFWHVKGESQSAALDIGWTLLYRLVKVSAEEIVGLISA